MAELVVGSVVTRFWEGRAGEGSESSDLRRIEIAVSVFDERVETVRRAVGDEKRGCIDKKTDSLEFAERTTNLPHLGLSSRRHTVEFLAVDLRDEKFTRWKIIMLSELAPAPE